MDNNVVNNNEEPVMVNPNAGENPNSPQAPTPAEIIESVLPQEPAEKVIQTSSRVKKDGQMKCPNCGASEIQPNPKTGKLKCNYCGIEFDGKSLEGVEKNLKGLKGRIMGSGTSNINANAADVVTLKCGGCGAEVVIDTANAPHARCHWCRSILSINSQIENGAIPDAILPFQTPKEEARKKIEDFVGKRKFFAHPQFRKEFTTENIMGVYFPYMLVDGNAHATFDGEGEHETRRYTVGSGDDKETRYDADAYHVNRDFDITIEGLTIESNSTRLDKSSNTQTNNIINSIMPFDTENCIQYESNYLVGYTSERRDVNIGDLEEKVEKQMKDISKFAIKADLKYYDRGLSWKTENFQLIGSQWIAAYLPVWLYSYQQVKGEKKILHYVAVNARTGETMGSVPINQPLLIGMSVLVEFIFGFIGVMLAFMPSDNDDDGNGFLLLLLSGFIFYAIMYARYRNKGARHTYEKETKNNIDNIKRVDQLIEHRKGLKNSQIKDRNDYVLEGEQVSLTEKFIQKNMKKGS